MIESFRSKPLRLFFEKDDPSKIKPDHIGIVRQILSRLDAAIEFKDMNAPSLKLHPLKGDRKGEWAVTVKKNWRVTFKIENGKVFDVDYEDYH
ncbi:MAG: type II toxin-antitoxin system RelE/ParE family toxin [Ekhidna sp.]|nr:type II toxin-antitoxin system RelE/ParE family toxin [Ekhidna sp.]